MTLPLFSHTYRNTQLDGIEDVQNYRPGGFHPISIGDTLDDRYKILHKLGHGAFSTLWLAQVVGRGRNVALKILTADSSSNENKELETLKHLQAHGAKHPNILHLQDQFEIQGPNGFHACLVLDVVGPSITRVAMGQTKVPKLVIREATRQIASGLACLHSLGVCHGDLTDSNVMLELKDIHLWSESEVYQNLGSPTIEPLRLMNSSRLPISAPEVVVQAIQYLNLDPNLFSGTARIGDFGQSFFLYAPPPEPPGIPASFFAPEMLFGFQASAASDVWALGCLIYELQASRTLFPTFFGTLGEALAMAVETLGPFPESWRDTFKGTTEISSLDHDPDHYWFNQKGDRNRSLESQLRSLYPQHSSADFDAFYDLLRGTLVYEPDDRLSARQVVDHKWFTK